MKLLAIGYLYSHFLPAMQVTDTTQLPAWGATGLAGTVIWLWRSDREREKKGMEDREKERKAQEDRYTALAQDFRAIVQENTKAITTLTEHVQSIAKKS